MISIIKGFISIIVTKNFFLVLHLKRKFSPSWNWLKNVILKFLKWCRGSGSLQHRNKTRKGQDHWFLHNQSDYSLFAALILLLYWNFNCVLQTNNLSSHCTVGEWVSLWENEFYYWKNPGNSFKFVAIL